MSLTTKTMIELKDKSFDKLYASGAERYKELAIRTVWYLRTCGAAGDKVWLGDVAAVLERTIANQQEFLAHLNDRKLTAGAWPMSFAEYILEQVYPQPELKDVK